MAGLVSEYKKSPLKGKKLWQKEFYLGRKLDQKF